MKSLQQHRMKSLQQHRRAPFVTSPTLQAMAPPTPLCTATTATSSPTWRNAEVDSNVPGARLRPDVAKPRPAVTPDDPGGHQLHPRAALDRADRAGGHRPSDSLAACTPSDLKGRLRHRRREGVPEKGPAPLDELLDLVIRQRSGDHGGEGRHIDGCRRTHFGRQASATAGSAGGWGSTATAGSAGGWGAATADSDEGGAGGDGGEGEPAEVRSAPAAGLLVSKFRPCE